MKIEVDGVQYSSFVGASVILRLDALTNTFSFEAASEDGRPLPFEGGEACKVFVDGEQVLDGFIELVNVEGDSSTHKIDVQGRDKTGDFLDSSISVLDDFVPPISLREIIERVIAHLGLDLSVVDEASPEPFNEAEDLFAPEQGANAFEFVEKYARKRQVLLTSNADGSIVIASPTGTPSSSYVRHLIDDDSNNVLSYSVSRDQTGRFNLYQSFSQRNAVPASVYGGASRELAAILDAIIAQGDARTVFDAAIREGRQHILVAESMSSDGEDFNRATWELKVRRARGNVYSATMDGFRGQSGELWAVNDLVSVRDAYARIGSTMLVNSVTFSMDGEGRSTTVSLVEKDAYTLSLEEPEQDDSGFA
jgi:prophage tail gpP-like protein